MDYAAGIQLLWIQLTTATILHKGASYKISYSIVKVYYLPMFFILKLKMKEYSYEVTR